MYRSNLKFVALPVPEIIAIGVLGVVAKPKSWGRGGRTGSGMVPFERAFVSFYRPSIGTFPLNSRVSREIAAFVLQHTTFPYFLTPPLVSPNFLFGLQRVKVLG